MLAPLQVKNVAAIAEWKQRSTQKHNRREN